jgi:hypothetical protein
MSGPRNLVFIDNDAATCEAIASEVLRGEALNFDLLLTIPIATRSPVFPMLFGMSVPVGG